MAMMECSRQSFVLYNPTALAAFPGNREPTRMYRRGLRSLPSLHPEIHEASVKALLGATLRLQIGGTRLPLRCPAVGPGPVKASPLRDLRPALSRSRPVATNFGPVEDPSRRPSGPRTPTSLSLR